MAWSFLRVEHADGNVPDRDGVLVDDPASVLAATRARPDNALVDPQGLRAWGTAAFRIVDEDGSMRLVSVLSLVDPRRQAA